MSVGIQESISADSREATGAGTPADALELTSMSTLEDDGNQSVECPTCDQQFDSQHGVKIHHSKIHGESLKPTVVCEWCEDEFHVKPKDLDARFCSRECKNTHQRGGEKPSADQLRRLHWDENMPVLKMADVFDVSRRTITRWMDDYGIDRRGRSEAEALKWRQMSRTERSRQIAAAHEAVRETVEAGEWHLQTDDPIRRGYGPGWNEEKRERVREAYDRTCQGCGRTEAEEIADIGSRLDVHHVIPAGEFDDPERRNAMENLVPFCRSCHRRWEGIPLRPEVSDVL